MLFKQKYWLFLITIALFSCESNDKTPPSKIEQVISIEHQNDTIQLPDTNKTINLDTLSTDEEIVNTNCLVTAYVKYNHGLLGAPKIIGDTTELSFEDIVKRWKEKRNEYRIDFNSKDTTISVFLSPKNKYRKEFSVPKGGKYNLSIFEKNTDGSYIPSSYFNWETDKRVIIGQKEKIRVPIIITIFTT